VKRQYCGRVGKTENCQSGVFLAFAGDNGYGLVDYELYLPKEWFGKILHSFTKNAIFRKKKHFPRKMRLP